MPWLEVKPMEERIRFVALAESGAGTVTELCRQFGISRKTGYKWIARKRDHGLEGLRDRSRRPRSGARGVEARTVKLIVELKRRHPRWGPKKIRRLLRLVPATVSLIDGEALSVAGGGNLLEAMRETSGLNLVGRGVGGRKVMLLRGMESRHSLFLVDGRRISSTDDVVGHSDFQYDWIPASAVERVEVIRGPMSALYGSEAMGGVVNIITRPVPTEWSKQVSILADTREDGRGGDLSAYSFSAAGPLGESFGLKVNASYRYMDDTPTAENANVSELEGDDLRGLNLELDWVANDSHRFEFVWNHSDEERWRQTTARSGAAYWSSYDLLKQQVGLRWMPTIGEWSGKVGAYQTTSDVENRATEGGSPSTPQYLTDRIVDFDFSSFVTREHQVTVGGEFREETLEHSSFDGGEANATHAALFAQDKWSLGESLSATGAVRVDDHELFGTEFTPRLYLVKEFGDALVLKGGYGSGFRAPTLKQISEEYKFVGPHTFIGNPELEPESSETWEVSALWEPSETVSVSATAYRNDVTDLITSVAIENVTARLGRVYQYFNVDSARIDGLETEIVWRPMERARFAFGHTWMDAQDLSNDRHLPARPEHRLTANLRYGFSSALSWIVSGEYNGKQWEIAADGSELEMPSYSLFSTHLNWNVSDAAKIAVGVRNIGDVDLSERSDSYGYAERGRSYFVRWSGEF